METTSWSCFISTLLNLDLWGFSSSIANGRPANQTKRENKNISFITFQVTKSSASAAFNKKNLTVSKSPDIHVLPARRGEIKSCNKIKREIYQDSFRILLLSNSTLIRGNQPSKCGLAVGSEGRQDGRCDQLLHRGLHPPLSIDHPGSLRQTATELVVSPWTTGTTSGRKTDPLLILNLYNKMQTDSFGVLQYLPQRQTRGDTGRPESCSCWSAVQADTGSVWKQKNHHFKLLFLRKHQELRYKSDAYFRNLASDIFSRALTTAILVNTDYRQKKHTHRLYTLHCNIQCISCMYSCNAPSRLFSNKLSIVVISFQSQSIMLATDL